MNLRMKIIIYLSLIIPFYFISSKSVLASFPSGHLEKADGGIIAGWAKDDDFDGSIPVHIYIDGKLYEDILADLFRSDVGKHSFYYNYASLGGGNHTVEVYAIGVDSFGHPNGENPLLGKASINEGCSRLTGSAVEWCQGNLNYWINRQKDTTYLWNKYIRIGIDNSYGGLISQLYSEDRSSNLVDEHGGSAIQISLYGYDLSKGNTGAWFVADGSNCNKYSSEAECKNANLQKSCVQRAAANGAHTADCIVVKPCSNNHVDAGFPFNPIQAQAVDCKWDDSTNDVDYSASCGSNCWEVKLDNPANYSKSSSFDGLTIIQRVSLGDVYAKVDYDLKYNGPFTLSNHFQEIPAFFTAGDISGYFYFYNGKQPWKFDNVAEIKRESIGIGNGNSKALAFPNFNLGQDVLKPYDSSREYWMGVCSSDKTKCVTIATFSRDVQSITLQVNENTTAYIAPMGYFNLYPGMEKKISLYIFPYKYDKVINGKSIRQRIYELATNEGVNLSSSDLNNDGKVDIFDYNILMSDFGKTGVAGFTKSDINKDGKVDIFDYNILISNFGK